MRVTVNGDAREMRDGLTIDELVATLGLGTRRVAVEINLDVVPRADYAQRALCDGDIVEIVQFIGGG
ncbi:MAG: sulfur carrier protein ThiS [bacterium]